MNPLSRFLAFLLLLPFAAQAQIGATSGDEYYIDWSGWNAPVRGAEHNFRQSLQRGLDISSVFKSGDSVRKDFEISGFSREEGGNILVQLKLHSPNLKKTYFHKEWKQPAGDARKLGLLVADEIFFAATRERGIANSQIALLGKRTGKTELYVVDADGKGLQQVTREGSIIMEPKFAPNGSSVVFTSHAGGFPACWQMDLLNPSAAKSFASRAGLNAGASVSPDGREIAFVSSRQGRQEVYVMQQNGDTRRLTHSPKGSSKSSTCWSPDGREIVFVDDRTGKPQLFIVGKNGGEPRRLTHSAAENTEPCWGKNGKIIYTAYLRGSSELRIYDTRTRADTRVPISESGSWKEPSWAPNGRHIAATREIAHEDDVYVVDTNTGRTIPLVTSRDEWFSATWKP